MDSTLTAGNNMLANALRPKREGRLFEEFLVVGVSPERQLNVGPTKPLHAEPTILYRYPSDEILAAEHAANFCFPTKCEVKGVERTKSASGFNEMLFGQLSKVEHGDKSFVFLISGQENLLYGICVANTELLHERNSFLSNVELPEAESRSKYDYFTTRVYCLLSKFPFFQLHFEVIYSMLAREHLTKISSILGVTADDGPGQENCSALQILRAYYEKAVPTENNSLNFKLPGELRSFEFHCPPGDEDKQIAEFAVLTLLGKLSLENIITLFTSILLERQVVIVCKELGVLSSIVLSILPLLRPFTFQGPFIPILPEELHEYLDAPVPFIIGIPRLPNDHDIMDRLENDKVIFHIDDGKVSIPKSMKIPSLPNEKKLTKILKPLYKEFLDMKTKGGSSRASQLKLVPDVVYAFRQYNTWLIDDVIITAIKDTKLVSFDFDSEEHIEKLVQEAPRSMRDFLSTFLKSQQFSSYADKLKEVVNSNQTGTTTRVEKQLSKEFVSIFDDVLSSPKRFFKQRALTDIDLKLPSFDVGSPKKKPQIAEIS